MPYASSLSERMKYVTRSPEKESDESNEENDDEEPEELGDLNTLIDDGGITHLPISSELDHILAAHRDCPIGDSQHSPQRYGESEPNQYQYAPMPPAFQSMKTYANRLRQSKCILPAYVADEIANTTGATASDEIEDGIRKGQSYLSKSHLYEELSLHAIDKNFQISTYKSTPSFVVYVCKAGKDNCTWRVRASRDNAIVDSVTITKYVPEHTCGYRPIRRGDHRQATPTVIGRIFKENVMTSGDTFRARDLQTSARTLYGLNIDYQKAYRCREKAIQLIQGTAEESYAQLPAYFYMLMQKNEGTICDIAVDEAGAFLYCYFSLGVCLSGFKWCRPLICVDGTHLKIRYHGALLCAIALDADSHLYPLAFAIVDQEDDDSYNYFMEWLKKSIGDVEGLVFVSDRHDSINKAIIKHFPDAHHGICYYHLKGNIKQRYKDTACLQELKKAAYAYTESQFMIHYSAINEMNNTLANDLLNIGFSRWARAYFPGMRYAVITNNYCESFNCKLRDARKWAITSLVEYVRAVAQKWHSDRIKEANEVRTFLAPKMETMLRQCMDHSRYLLVEPISMYKFYVKGSKTTACVVNLENMTCDCRKFDVHGIPCEHAVAAIDHRSGDVREFCFWYFTADTLISTYTNHVYPCGDESEWIVPEHIRQWNVGVPNPRPSVGRPKNRKGRLKTKRILSQGETSWSRNQCSQCGKRGHNKATCRWN